MKHLVVVGLVLTAVMISGCIDAGEYRNKSVTVVDKTAEVIPSGYSSRTDYKVLADDGTVYHTTWEIYRGMEINGSYQIQARNACPRDPCWRILLVEER